LCDQITHHFANRGKEVTIKYIDPSYIIRGVPANSVDSEYGLLLGQHAVHAGMAGRTDIVVGSWNSHFAHSPIGVTVVRRKQLDPEGDVWQRVLEATGQPVSMPLSIPAIISMSMRSPIMTVSSEWTPSWRRAERIMRGVAVVAESAPSPGQK
jgi:hypothetical protein